MNRNTKVSRCAKNLRSISMEVKLCFDGVFFENRTVHVTTTADEPLKAKIYSMRWEIGMSAVMSRSRLPYKFSLIGKSERH